MKYCELLTESFKLPVIKPSTDDVHEVMNANFEYGKLLGSKIVPLYKLHGGVDLNDRSQAARIEKLKASLSSANGYISRLIVDTDGNVIEGQHRYEALKQLGAKAAPCSVIKDLAKHINLSALAAVIKTAQPMPSDNVHQLIRIVLEAVDEEGSAQAVIDEYDAPRGFERGFKAALEYLTTQHR